MIKVRKAFLIFLLFLGFFFGGCLNQKDDLEILNQAYNSVLSDYDLRNITTDIVLNTYFEDIYIEYISDKPSVLRIDSNSQRGYVYQKSADVVVNIMITVSNEISSLTKTKTLIIKKISDIAYLESKINSFQKEVIASNSGNSFIKNDLNFLTSYEGLTISYNSASKDLISDSGQVTPTSSERFVKVDALLSYKSSTKLISFNFVVLRSGFDSEVALLLNSFQGIDFDHLTTDIALEEKLEEYSVTYQSSDLNVLSNDGKIALVKQITAVNLLITMTKNSTIYEKSIILTIYPLSDVNKGINHTDLFQEQLKQFNKRTLNNGQIGLPSFGKVNILVFMIELSDYPFPEGAKKRVENAFFGSKAQNGCESVSEYYYESSFGKLEIAGTVFDPISVNMSANSFSKIYGDKMPNISIDKAMEKYHNDLTLSDYDQNRDQALDGIYLIYSAQEETNTSYWAWQSQYLNEKDYQGIKPNYYFWGSINFLNRNLSNGDKVVNNTEIYIHETGHLLGLDDYYDYNNQTSYLGRTDMMDGNYGDHNVFSKMILGWISPYIILESKIVKIRLSELYGDTLLIPAKWSDSYFSEYLLIDYFGGKRLNEAYYQKGYFNNTGIRIYHVSAFLGRRISNDYGSPFILGNTFGNETFQGSPHPLIKYLAATSNINLVDDYLFQSGAVLNGARYSWYQSYYFDGVSSKKFNFNINILSINQNEAKISIEYF